MSQLSDLDRRFLNVLDLALDFDHPNLPINEFKEALNAPNFNRKELYDLIKTCPSLYTQFEAAQEKISTNAEKSKGRLFPTEAIDTEAESSTEQSNKVVVNLSDSLLDAVLKKIDQIKLQPTK